MKAAVDLIRAGEPGPIDFEPTVGLGDLDRLLASGLRAPTFRMIRGEEQLHPAELLRPSHAWGVTTVEDSAHPPKIFTRLRQGWTLVLDQAHRQVGPLAALNRGYEKALSARSRVDLSLVPAGGTGPLPERLDNVLLGLHGVSRFQVGDRTVELRRGQGFVAPRVDVHPLPVDALSCYAVVAVARVTWREVLLDAFEHFDDPLGHLEARIDAHGPKQLSDAERAQWEAFVERFMEEVDAEDALDRIASQIVRTRLPYLPNSVRVGQEPELTPNTWVARRPEVMYRIHEDEQGAHLVFNSSDITVIHKARPVLEFVADQPAFCPAQLPFVPEDQRVPFVRSLLDAGFLILREVGEPHAGPAADHHDPGLEALHGREAGAAAGLDQEAVLPGEASAGLQSLLVAHEHALHRVAAGPGQGLRGDLAGAEGLGDRGDGADVDRLPGLHRRAQAGRAVGLDREDGRPPAPAAQALGDPAEQAPAPHAEHHGGGLLRELLDEGGVASPHERVVEGVDVGRPGPDQGAGVGVGLVPDAPGLDDLRPVVADALEHPLRGGARGDHDDLDAEGAPGEGGGQPGVAAAGGDQPGGASLHVVPREVTDAADLEGAGGLQGLELELDPEQPGVVDEGRGDVHPSS